MWRPSRPSLPCSVARHESRALAEVELGIPILPPDMDSDPWSFNCRNGTIDLRTSKLRPHRREDMITKLCDIDFDPKAECPLWESTMEKFFRSRSSGYNSLSSYGLSENRMT